MKIFIVAAFFPPINMIGAVRPYQLAKFFVDQGHSVTVFTSYGDNNSSKDFNVDLSQFNVIDIEPNEIVSLLDYEHPKSQSNKLFKQIARTLIYPDHFILKKKAFLKCINSEIIKNGTPDYIFSMGLPFSLHCICKDIKNKYSNIIWIADNRDLWATTTYRKIPLFLRIIDKEIEKKVFAEADLILAVTNHMKVIMEKYLKREVHVIRNGFSLENINQDKSKCESIVYTGGLYNGLRDIDPLLIALDKIKSKMIISFYGSEENIVNGYRDKYKELNIKYFSKKSKSEIIDIQNSASYLVIALGKDFFEKGVLTGKFFEYVRARKPIIAICDEDSELAYLINKYALGIATRDPDKLSKFILNNTRFFNELPEELSINNQFIKLYDLMKKGISC